MFDPEPHTYTFQGEVYDSVSQIIRKAGLGDDFSAVSSDRMEYAQTRGRMVHAACHYYDEGDLHMGSVAPEIRGYVDAYMRFREDRKLKIVAVEKKMVSPWGCGTCGHDDNDHQLSMGPCDEPKCQCQKYIQGLGIAGTPDLIAFMAGVRCVFDRKTSQYMSRAMGLQTKGYQIIWNQNHPNEPVRERYGLRLEKTGKYKLIPHDSHDDGHAFVDCIGAAQSKDQMDLWRVKYGAK